MPLRKNFLVLTLVWAAFAWTAPAHSVQSSYATLAVDVAGVTGSPTVAINAPNYRFVNDLGLGFGGTNSDVFAVGESALFSFPVPLRNIPGQQDLILYAFVGGLGATDNANVQVEASSNGTNFTIISTFNTSTARNRSQDFFENNFEAVKHFFVEFGSVDNVTHIRLTNLAGTSEGLRLDALEGLHPDVAATHAFELRLERSRYDEWQQFKLRLKNIGDPGGAAIHEIRINNSAINQNARLENTELPIRSIDGSFICVENCLPICPGDCQVNVNPIAPFARFAWSVDGLVEAPLGVGLAPGRRAAHIPAFGIDTDSIDPYLSGYSFEIMFTDGSSQFVDYDLDLEKEIGSLYEKHLYFSDLPDLSWNRPVDFYEFAAGDHPAVVPSLSGPSLSLLVLLVAGSGWWLVGARPRRDDSTHSA